MKYLITCLFSLMALKSYCQCSIQKSISGEMNIYEARNEKLYKNDDLENGIQAAYIKLVVYQDLNNKENLKFYINLSSAKSGNKSLVVPRKLLIKYDDGTQLPLNAENLNGLRKEGNFYIQECSFRLYSWLFNDIQTKGISQIVISDNRTGNKLVCTPYANLLKEQANCIGNKLE